MAQHPRAARGSRVRVVRLRAGDERRVRAAADLFDHPPVRAAVRRYLAQRANRFLLAFHGDTAVGFLRGTDLRQIETSRPQFFVYEVAVAPGWRRRGVGRALLGHLLRALRREGFEEAFVFTSPRNRAAVGLYRSTGAVTETSADRMFVYRLRSAKRALRRGPPRSRAGPGRTPADRGVAAED